MFLAASLMGGQSEIAVVAAQIGLVQGGRRAPVRAGSIWPPAWTFTAAVFSA